MLNKARHPLRRLRPWWHGLSARERRAVALTALLLGTTLWWLVLVQPALARIAHWEAETPRLRSQAQTLDGLLAHAPSLPGAAQQAPALRQSLEHAGLGGHYQLQAVQGGWQLDLAQAPAEAATAWLLQAPAQLGLTVVHSRLQR
ncbi:type II secretion system protein GspM, partial [Pseudomonas palmensis]